jgi:hypothetical protein
MLIFNAYWLLFAFASATLFLVRRVDQRADAPIA